MKDPIKTLLPAEGIGYVTYRREKGGADQYGTQGTIKAIERIGREWARLHPERPFSVGDISRQGGGPFPPHASHQQGRDVDFRPMRADRQNLPCTWNDRGYSRPYTRELIKFLRAHARIIAIFFNDPVLIQEKLVQRCTGHDNHLHVRFAE